MAQHKNGLFTDVPPGFLRWGQISRPAVQDTKRTPPLKMSRYKNVFFTEGFLRWDRMSRAAVQDTLADMLRDDFEVDAEF